VPQADCLCAILTLSLSVSSLLFLSLCSIEWAREKFDDLFVSGADSVNSLLESREQFLQKLKQDPLSEADALKAVKNWCGLQRICVRVGTVGKAR